MSSLLDCVRHCCWASLCGGWFYDPHQNVFCNCAHLYIWLFLLCFPFVTYLYFPATFLTWIVYCIIIAFFITILKLVNFQLHKMYDARTLSETHLRKDSGNRTTTASLNNNNNNNSKLQREVSGDEDGGIEMQVLKTPPVELSSSSVDAEHQSQCGEISCANSTISIDYQEQLASTIDLKVDVHRKNSSESSDNSVGVYQTAASSTASNNKAKKSKSDEHREKDRQQDKSENLNTTNSRKQQLNTRSNLNVNSSSNSNNNNSNNNNNNNSSDFINKNSSCNNNNDNNNIKVNSIVPGTINSIKSDDTKRIRKKRSFDKTTVNDDSYQEIMTIAGLPACTSASSSAINFNNTASSRRHQYKSLKQTRSTSNSQLQSKLHRQISLDSDKIGMGMSGAVGTSSSSTFQSEATNLGNYSQMHRHFNSEDRSSSQKIKSLYHNHHQHLPLHHHHQHVHHPSVTSCSSTSHNHPNNNNNNNNHHPNKIMLMKNSDSELYLENNYTTKSALQLASDINISSQSEKTIQQSAPFRRDSNSTMSALQLPTLSAPSTSGYLHNSTSSSSKLRRHSNTTGTSSNLNKQNLHQMATVRKTKSAFVNSCEQAASVSNLTPHPASVEVISDGKTIRNPNTPVLPPPSKCLSRNPHLNLFPAPIAGNSDTTINEMNLQNSDLVYPIAEGGKNELEIEDDEEEDEAGDSGLYCCGHPISESESDLENVSDSESDPHPNGSRSPLLDNITPMPEVEEKKSDPDEIIDIEKQETDAKQEEEEEEDEEEEEEENKNTNTNHSSSEWEQASASSKDQLIVKKSQSEDLEVEELKYYDSYENPIPESESLKEKAISSSMSTSQIANPPRNLGAIPKTRGGIRKLSFGEDFPVNKNYQRTLSQRSTSDRIPENNAIPSNPRMISLLNSNESTIPIFLPGSSSGGLCEVPRFSTFRSTSATFGDSRLTTHSVHRRPRYNRTRNSIESFTKQQAHLMIAMEAQDGDCNICVDHEEPKNDDKRLVIDTTEMGLNFLHDGSDHQLIQQILSTKGSTISSTINELTQQRQLQANSYRILPRPVLPDARDYSSSHLSSQSMEMVPCASILNESAKPKRYKLPISVCGMRKNIELTMNRLQLLALFDKDQNWWQILLACILCILVAVLGATVLHQNIYKDIYAFIFCFVIAGSQYSLLKSVQPDASSPIHGFNKTVTYSRPIYFCLLTMLMLLSQKVNLEFRSDWSSNYNETLNYVNSTLFGCLIAWGEFLNYITYFLSIVILFLPLLFSLGLFPQINTFLMYFFEQVDMHVFGGNAVCNLLAGFLAIFRSIIACAMLYGFIYGGLVESNNTQHILVSIFCGLLIPMAYHLSRSSSDFTHLFQLIKSTLLMHGDDDSCVDVATNSSNTKDEDKPDDADDVSNQSAESETEQQQAAHLDDPLPKKLQGTVIGRLKNDLVVCPVIGLAFFALHTSTIFTVLQPDVQNVLYAIAIVFGLILHYIIPQMRKHLPCLCVAAPILRQNEYGKFEVDTPSKVMWFEKIYIYLCFMERNILYPLIVCSAITADSVKIADKFGIGLGAALIVICSLKALRSSYSDTGSQYLIILFSVLFFRIDYKIASETFLLDYFLVSIIFKKVCDLLLKLQFVVTYIAPWQITWGSAFHAFAQPFSVPHSAMLFLQTGISAVLSTPLNPFLGSAIFLTSYARPIKFWERDYNTRRIDHSNTRLCSQLERDLGADDNNLNSIFYEHLTRSLQHSLCGDLLMGRWGIVSQGDCFVLASDYLNCLVHIIELGNGLCTFQMRGLEFRGTYCQQREVEAISEGVEENEGCCCCSPGHLPHMLSVNAMFTTRWLAWQVIASQYVLEGYSISDNSAVATLQVFEFRKVLISYYVKSIIYYTIKSTKLQQWLDSKEIQEFLAPTQDRNFVDLDPIFNHNLDDDFDSRVSGITRSSFWSIYEHWIRFCVEQKHIQQRQEKEKREQQKQQSLQRQQQQQQQRRTGAGVQQQSSSGRLTSLREPAQCSNSQSPNPKEEDTEKSEDKEKDDTSTIDCSKDSVLVSLCLSLTLLARRTLATASHSASSLSVEFFLHGLHSLFKGDFRITSSRDEWVFTDMDLLHTVVAPAVRMSLKLHQDHFLSPEEYDVPKNLYQSIEQHTKELVISHEADPLWRNAVLRGSPNLLALRHVMEDGTDEYRVIRLTKRFLNFRVIKLNRECVRGLWAGQQQELIYLRNRNPERGSIQNAKQALRNIINSSCDQPIGYPIYVSPLTTSYADTNEQICKVIGGEITLEKIQKLVLSAWDRIRKRCREGCSSGSSGIENAENVQELGNISANVYGNSQALNSSQFSQNAGTISYGSQSGRESILGGTTRGSLASINKPTSSNLLGLLNPRYDMTAEHSQLRERSISKKNLTTVSTSNIARESKTEKQLKRESFVINPTMTNANSTSNSSSLKQESIESHHSVGLKRGESFCEEIHPTDVVPPKQESDEVGQTREEASELYQDDEKVEEEVLIRRPHLPLDKKVIIVDVNQVYDSLDLGRGIDMKWPSDKMRAAGGRDGWGSWYPQEGMVGNIVHVWVPFHPDPYFCSKVNHIVLLIRIQDKFVPIHEQGVKEYKIITAPLAPIATTSATVDEETGNDSNKNSSNIYLEEC